VELSGTGKKKGSLRVKTNGEGSQGKKWNVRKIGGEGGLEKMKKAEVGGGSKKRGLM